MFKNVHSTQQALFCLPIFHDSIPRQKIILNLRHNYIGCWFLLLLCSKALSQKQARCHFHFNQAEFRTLLKAIKEDGIQSQQTYKARKASLHRLFLKARSRMIGRWNTSSGSYDKPLGANYPQGRNCRVRWKERLTKELIEED